MVSIAKWEGRWLIILSKGPAWVVSIVSLVSSVISIASGKSRRWVSSHLTEVMEAAWLSVGNAWVLVSRVSGSISLTEVVEAAWLTVGDAWVLVSWVSRSVSLDEGPAWVVLTVILVSGVITIASSKTRWLIILGEGPAWIVLTVVFVSGVVSIASGETRRLVVLSEGPAWVVFAVIFVSRVVTIASGEAGWLIITHFSEGSWSVEAVPLLLFSWSSSADWVLIVPSGNSAVLHVGSVGSIADTIGLHKSSWSVKAVSFLLFSWSASADWVLVVPSGNSAVLHVGSVGSVTDSLRVELDEPGELTLLDLLVTEAGGPLLLRLKLVSTGVCEQ
jgi:hypothetical protein